MACSLLRHSNGDSRVELIKCCLVGKIRAVVLTVGEYDTAANCGIKRTNFIHFLQILVNISLDIKNYGK